MRRAAVAIPTNIVEGNARSHVREYVQFCHIARASIAKVKYLLRLGLDLKVVSTESYNSIYDGYDHVGAMLQALINRLENKVQLN